jgi:hypothetical protein
LLVIPIGQQSIQDPSFRRSRVAKELFRSSRSGIDEVKMNSIYRSDRRNGSLESFEKDISAGRRDGRRAVKDEHDWGQVCLVS